MDNHVPKLETCKNLKEIGYPQEESSFYFIRNSIVYKYQCYSCHDRSVWQQQLKHRDDMFAAPLATELLEILPTTIKDKDDRLFEILIQEDNPSNSRLWNIAYANYNQHAYCLHSTTHHNFIEALAQMLIYLVENQIVSLEKGESNVKTN